MSGIERDPFTSHEVLSDMASQFGEVDIPHGFMDRVGPLEDMSDDGLDALICYIDEQYTELELPRYRELIDLEIMTEEDVILLFPLYARWKNQQNRLKAAAEDEGLS